jgi:AraC-like DNA-binding protein
MSVAPSESRHTSGRPERQQNGETPRVVAWQTTLGLFERYTYPPGPAGRDRVHVHPDVQVCVSVNFPGRYRSGHYSLDVPAGSVSIVDAWEPHAAEDPVDRGTAAIYRVLYIPKERWDQAAADIGQPAGVGIVVHRRASIARAVTSMHIRAERGASALEEDERFSVMMAMLLGARRRGRPRRESLRRQADLDRAREFIRVHALRGVTLAEAAREAGLGARHFATVFRARYGLPVHQFQTLMRIDHARRLLALGVAPADVAAECGLSDQSHLTRHFRRYLGLTPGRYRALGREGR